MHFTRGFALYCICTFSPLHIIFVSMLLDIKITFVSHVMMFLMIYEYQDDILHMMKAVKYGTSFLHTNYNVNNL